MTKDVSSETRELKTFTENLVEILVERNWTTAQISTYTINDEAWAALQRTLDQIVKRLRVDVR